MIILIQIDFYEGILIMMLGYLSLFPGFHPKIYLSNLSLLAQRQQIHLRGLVPNRTQEFLFF
jgi:hypothetical protein